MTAYHAKLGVAADQTSGPLVTEPNGTGKRFAVWPSFANGLLLVGSTGNGKSTLLRYMTTNLVRSPGSKALYLCDGKFSGAFLMFRGVPGVAEIVTTPEQITATVRGYFAEVEERYTALSAAREQAQRSRSAPDYQPPGPLFLILDEYLNWVLSLSDRDRKEIIAKLVRVGSIGREVNCRLVIATQRPGTKDGGDTGLPGTLKAQLRCRVGMLGQVGLDSIETRMAFDDDSYSAKLAGHSRPGAGFVKVGAHEVRFVVPWLADPTDPDTSDADRQTVWDLLFPREDGS